MKENGATGLCGPPAVPIINNYYLPIHQTIFLSYVRFHFNNISVIMVTGGKRGSVGTSVELLASNGTRLCFLPRLPAARFYHVQSGLIACGGGTRVARFSCSTFAGGSWKKSHTLGKRREDSTAWASPQGVLIIGGNLREVRRTGDQTTELLTYNGRSTPSFKLKNMRK